MNYHIQYCCCLVEIKLLTVMLILFHGVLETYIWSHMFHWTYNDSITWHVSIWPILLKGLVPGCDRCKVGWQWKRNKSSGIAGDFFLCICPKIQIYNIQAKSTIVLKSKKPCLQDFSQKKYHNPVCALGIWHCCKVYFENCMFHPRPSLTTR